ncbi:hypothetical protein AB4090_01880 [Acidithiobacillus sp. IBUN Pt1247-S3]|uniref:hypothetical protein n=1 Tax=Acidithiobacillus sp. IBUN Pt1247-S3 TaxID=3166642 RepID=UPI0034E49EE4
MNVEDKTVIEDLMRNFENDTTLHYLQFLQASGMSWEACTRKLFRSWDTYDPNFLAEETARVGGELHLPQGAGPESLGELLQFRAQMDLRFQQALPEGLPDWESLDLPGTAPPSWYLEENAKAISIDDQIRKTLLEEWSDPIKTASHDKDNAL